MAQALWTRANDALTSLSASPAARAVVLGLVALKLGVDLWPYFRPSSLGKYYNQDGPTWALVTGASDGIGRGFAEVLLERGFNVILHGRNPSKLERVKADLLKDNPKRKVEIIVADASQMDVDFNAIVERVKALDGKLTILVNNVGGNTVEPMYSALDQMSGENIDTIINLNARFTTHITARLLPILKANSPSAIVSCSSVAGVKGMPYVLTYSGTKAFISAFSGGLRMELSKTGEGSEPGVDVDVLGLLIGNVKTAGNDSDDMPLFTLTARQTAVGGLNKIGVNSSIVWAHWLHALQFQMLSVLPGSLFNSTITRIMKQRGVDELGKKTKKKEA